MVAAAGKLNDLFTNESVYVGVRIWSDQYLDFKSQISEIMIHLNRIVVISDSLAEAT